MGKTSGLFLELKHTQLDVYKVSKLMVQQCYSETKHFPPGEKFAMVSQIRRAALSVLLNVAEGCSRKSQKERTRFFEIARGSVTEVDTALDIAIELNYTSKQKVALLGSLLIRCFQMISKMM